MKYLDVKTDYERRYVIITMKGENNRGISFTGDFLSELYRTLGQLEADEGINSVILTSDDRMFCVGGNINRMKESLDAGDASLYLTEIVPLINRIVAKIVSYKIPVITAINGAAAGGGLSLALSGDHRVAYKDAKFAMAFGTIGLTPDSGSSVMFPLRFGLSNAMFGIATGKVFSAEEAYKLGAIDKIVDNIDDLLPAAETFAIEYGKMDRNTICRTKELLNRDIVRKLEENLPLEFEAITLSASQNAFKERLLAYINK